MARLPVPGEDDGLWGGILNTFLLVEHTAEGTLRSAVKSVNGSTPDAAGNVVVTGTQGEPGEQGATGEPGPVGGYAPYTLPTYILEANQGVEDLPNDFPEGGLVFKKSV